MTAVAAQAHRVLSPRAPSPDQFETVACYLCGCKSFTPFIWGEDDLTGKPGRFTFVTCEGCGLRYQNPRLAIDHIKAYYDKEAAAKIDARE